MSCISKKMLEITFVKKKYSRIVFCGQFFFYIFHMNVLSVFVYY